MDIGQYQLVQSASCLENEKWLFKTPYGKYELWHYDLPTRRLVSRDEIELAVSDRILINRIFGHCCFNYSQLHQAISFKKTFWNDYNIIPLTIKQWQFEKMFSLVLSEFVVFSVPKEDGSGFDIHIYHPDSNMIKVTIDWMHSDSISMWASEYYVIIWDKHGRCGKFDVQKNEMIYFTV